MSFLTIKCDTCGKIGNDGDFPQFDNETHICELCDLKEIVSETEAELEECQVEINNLKIRRGNIQRKIEELKEKLKVEEAK